jgi:hypothetical protein
VTLPMTKSGLKNKKPRSEVRPTKHGKQCYVWINGKAHPSSHVEPGLLGKHAFQAGRRQCEKRSGIAPRSFHAESSDTFSLNSCVIKISCWLAEDFGSHLSLTLYGKRSTAASTPISEPLGMFYRIRVLIWAIQTR